MKLRPADAQPVGASVLERAGARKPPRAAELRGSRQPSTATLCTQCLEMIDAKVFEREGKVWMDKTCPDHGSYTAVLADGVRHDYVADPRVEALGGSASA